MTPTELLDSIILHLASAQSAIEAKNLRKMHKFIQAAACLSQELDNRLSGLQPPKHDTPTTLRP